MSLGLVSYEDSEESDDEVDSVTAREESTSSSKPTVSLSGATVDLETCEGTKSISSNTLDDFNDDELKPVKDSETTVHFYLPESRISSLNTDIDIKCLTSTSKRNGPVRITIPSLSEVEEDSEPPSKKKIKPSQKGSGLFALLPVPKGTLVPQSVANKNRNPLSNKPSTATRSVNRPKLLPKAPVMNRPSLINYEDSGDEDEPSGTVDFFSLESKEEEVVPGPLDVDIGMPEVSQRPVQNAPLKDNSEDVSHFRSYPEASTSSSSSVAPQPADQYTTSHFMPVATKDLELDQEAMQQLCGRRDRLKMNEVNIIDVSGDAIMPDAREWLTKQLTEEQCQRTSHKKKDGPTTQQKRKHQITYLAFQAKENELELKNQWSNNRMSRKQTQAKYGF